MPDLAPLGVGEKHRFYPISPVQELRKQICDATRWGTPADQLRMGAAADGHRMTLIRPPVFPPLRQPQNARPHSGHACSRSASARIRPAARLATSRGRPNSRPAAAADRPSTRMRRAIASVAARRLVRAARRLKSLSRTGINPLEAGGQRFLVRLQSVRVVRRRRKYSAADLLPVFQYPQMPPAAQLDGARPDF